MKYLTIKIKSQKKMNGRKQYGGSPTEAPEKCARRVQNTTKKIRK
jgi:hypothetical protein